MRAPFYLPSTISTLVGVLSQEKPLSTKKDLEFILGEEKKSKSRSANIRFIFVLLFFLMLSFKHQLLLLWDNDWSGFVGISCKISKSIYSCFFPFTDAAGAGAC